MKFYSYDRETGLFVGSGKCRLSPIQHMVHLVPGSSTVIPPHKNLKVFQENKWNGEGWDIVENALGKTIGQYIQKAKEPKPEEPKKTLLDLFPVEKQLEFLAKNTVANFRKEYKKFELMVK